MFKSIKFIGLAAFLGSCGIVDSKYEEYETPETTEPPTTDECTKGLEAFAPIQAFIDSQCLSCHGDSGVGAGSLRVEASKQDSLIRRKPACLIGLDLHTLRVRLHAERRGARRDVRPRRRQRPRHRGQGRLQPERRAPGQQRRGAIRAGGQQRPRRWPLHTGAWCLRRGWRRIQLAHFLRGYRQRLQRQRRQCEPRIQ